MDFRLPTLAQPALRECVFGVRSSVAPEKLGQKIVLHRQLANLGVGLLYLLCIVLGLDRIPAKHFLSKYVCVANCRSGRDGELDEFVAM
jgi:hypothetical protein